MTISMRQYKIKLITSVVCKDRLYPLGESLLMVFDGLNVNRKNELDFHAKQDDYLGTLATVLSNLAQDKKNMEILQKRLLAKLRDDLEYMQDNYRLIRK